LIAGLRRRIFKREKPKADPKSWPGKPGPYKFKGIPDKVGAATRV
jgi:hypothetical protein